MTDNWLSTKFILTVAVLVMSYVLVFVGKMEAQTWFEFACIASGIYASANVAQKFSNPKPEEK